VVATKAGDSRTVDSNVIRKGLACVIVFDQALWLGYNNHVKAEAAAGTKGTQNNRQRVD